MKILICAHDQPNYINGPNIWLRRLLPELRNRGIEARLLFFTSGDPALCDSLNRLKQQGFLCDIYRGKQYTEHKIRWILNKINEEVPDVFIPNLIVPAYYAARWIKNAGIPTVGVLHSDDPFYRAIIEEFVKTGTDTPLSAIVCVSQFLTDLCESYGNNEFLVRKIPYGIPVPEQKASFATDTFRLIYAGRLVEKQKRISDVAHAFCKVVKEIPGTEAIIYGSGPDESNVRQIVQKNGHAIPVKLGGKIKNEDIQRHYLSGQVIVLLSDFEGLPIALMEAMACGLVPVCYNMRSGIPELIENNKTGIIVNDRREEFTATIRKLKNDNLIWSSISENAKLKIKNNYSIALNIRLWEDLLHELILRKKNVAVVESNPQIKLPSVNPDLLRSDNRWPGIGRYVFLTYKRYVTKIARRMGIH
jgi:colanic acid/amylovoran biosynthesis glycosyltransferase